MEPEELPHTTLYLITVGKLTLNAALADLLLFSAFRILTGCDSKIGRATYYSVESLPAKARMVRRVVSATGDEEEAAIVGALIEAVEKTHAPRNELAHALLTVDDHGDPGKLWQRINMRDMKQSARPVTEAYLKALTDQSRGSVGAAHVEIERLCKKRGVVAPPV